MIKSSNKRIKLLEVGDNVRIPIPSVDRSPLGPTSLVGAVLGVSSTGNNLQLGRNTERLRVAFLILKSLPVVAINSSLPLMSLMCSYPLGLRPGRRSGQPVPDAAVRRCANLAAATVIS